MNAEYLARQIAHSERAARGFRAQARAAREKGNREQAASNLAIARGEEDYTRQLRRKLALL